MFKPLRIISGNKPDKRPYVSYACHFTVCSKIIIIITVRCFIRRVFVGLYVDGLACMERNPVGRRILPFSPVLCVSRLQKLMRRYTSSLIQCQRRRIHGREGQVSAFSASACLNLVNEGRHSGQLSPGRNRNAFPLYRRLKRGVRVYNLLYVLCQRAHAISSSCVFAFPTTAASESSSAFVAASVIS